ncbi:MAG TPA: GAF domain-containing protein [Thermoanaerobaculia bacterium]|jgi:PAS domain S-box-containing protein|nr:GAF domain-containing protein [Thermoanaerobaculia bacterium]
MSITTVGSSPASDRFDALTKASSLMREGYSVRDIAEQLVDLCLRIVPADGIAIWRLDARERRWAITASRGLSPEFIAATLPDLAGGSTSRLLREPFLVDDPSHWQEVSGRSSLYDGEGIQRMLVLPLVIRGEAAGTICCYFRTVHELSAEDLAAARTFASVASNALSVSKLDRLAEVARIVSGELDLEKLVQAVTDAATELTAAHFGAFFYNVTNDAGESYMLYTISGVPREEFSKFPMPRNTEIFAPTFDGTGTVRSANIQKDPRYGRNAPYHGMPAGHLPVVSYLAVPVVTRDGIVLGGLFFGHEQEGVFSDAEERIAEALAAQAAVAIDNARLYRTLREDRARSAASERRYRSLVLTTPTRQAISTANADGFREEDSPSWRDLTGQSFEEMRGRGWLDAVAGADRDRVAHAWDKAIKTRSTFDEQYRLRLADGSYRWFASRSVPVYDAEGNVGEWICTTTDVHDARVTDDAQRLLAKATELFASSLDYEETLKTLTSLAVPEIADWCAVDMADEIHPPFRRIAIAHVDPEKMELAWEMYRRYPPDPEKSQIAAVLRSGKPQLVSTIPEGMLEKMVRDEEQLRISREVGLMSWMIVPLRSRGRVLGAVTFVSTDSRRRFTQVDLLHAEEFARRASVAIDNAMLYRDAQQANRAKDEFLATLSHELRTPMTSILGWARLLRMGLPADESIDAVEAIEKSALVQAQLIDDILDVSRIISGKLRVDPEPVDLRTIAEAALATVHPAAQAKNIEILTSFPPSLPAVAGDEGRLQQVIWNLLSNGIKFTPRGGTVTLRISVADSLLRLTVTDTGEGISPEFLPHVFEAFRQQDSSTTRIHGGIGLGLAIVRYIVELHGGSVSVESAGSGSGSMFTVELPVLESALQPPPQRDEPASRHSEPATLPLPSLAGIKVLAIDDQAYTRDIVAAILRRCGAEVTTASSVREALQCVTASAPDVIVCDIAMPQEDGYAFVRELRASATDIASLPVIALTAFGRAEDQESALASGFDDYLKKPVEPSDLANAVLRARR